MSLQYPQCEVPDCGCNADDLIWYYGGRVHALCTTHGLLYCMQDREIIGTVNGIATRVYRMPLYPERQVN